jgi:hypothetical protein
MKEVCSCGAKFDTLEQLYEHINAGMGTDYSPEDFEPELGIEMTPEQQTRLSALLSSPHHGFTMSQD